MSDKKDLHEAEMIALPSLRTMWVEGSVSNPARRFTTDQNQPKMDPDIMESTVKRLIAHLKNKK